MNREQYLERVTLQNDEYLVLIYVDGKVYTHFGWNVNFNRVDGITLSMELYRQRFKNNNITNVEIVEHIN